MMNVFNSTKNTLKIVKMVNFMVNVFYHNKKKMEKKEALSFRDTYGNIYRWNDMVSGIGVSMTQCVGLGQWVGLEIVWP